MYYDMAPLRAHQTLAYPPNQGYGQQAGLKRVQVGPRNTLGTYKGEKAF